MVVSSAGPDFKPEVKGPLSLKVLIADDEAGVVAEIAQGLRRRGFDVLVATSGDEAWTLLAEHDDIGAVVCDIRMPGLDGQALAQRIVAATTAACRVEVILISGHGTMVDEAIARDAGVFAFLRKPFLGSELRAALNQALSRAHAWRQGGGNAVNA
ncbi:MAG: response regulator [Rhodospirillales bacterium]